MLMRTLTVIAALALAAGCSKSKDKAPAEAPPEGATAGSAKEPAPTPTTHEEPAGDDHGDHGAAAEPMPTPTTLAEATTMLDAAYQELGAIVKDGDLSKAHMAADKLKHCSAALPDLATKAGLKPDDVKALTLASKKLGLLFTAMDEAGDGGKRDEAQKAFARYEEPMKTIKAKAVAPK